MQMIVTSMAENKIQAATIEIIKTVMAYSFNQISNRKPLFQKLSFHCAKLSNQGVVSLGSPAIMQSMECLDP